MPSLHFENSLRYHRPSEDQQNKIELLRAAQMQYADALEGLCPAGRELALAKTYFETSSMWAVKAIVITAPAVDVPEGAVNESLFLRRRFRQRRRRYESVFPQRFRSVSGSRALRKGKRTLPGCYCSFYRKRET
jgi:hypothetical protein